MHQYRLRKTEEDKEVEARLEARAGKKAEQRAGKARGTEDVEVDGSLSYVPELGRSKQGGVSSHPKL